MGLWANVGVPGPARRSRTGFTEPSRPSRGVLPIAFVVLGIIAGAFVFGFSLATKRKPFHGLVSLSIHAHRITSGYALRLRMVRGFEMGHIHK